MNMSIKPEIKFLLEYIDAITSDLLFDVENIESSSKKFSSENLDLAVQWMKLAAISFRNELRQVQYTLQELDKSYTYEKLLKTIEELKDPNADKKI